MPNQANNAFVGLELGSTRFLPSKRAGKRRRTGFFPFYQKLFVTYLGVGERGEASHEEKENPRRNKPYPPHLLETN